MKLIRNLVFPWIFFFLLATAGIVLSGIHFTRIHLTLEQLRFALAVGCLLCLVSNISSLGKVGIWMSESLPESLRYGSWRWILRSLKAAAIAVAFWAIGLLPWIPLVWQGAVIPSIFTITLFVAVFSLIGPILKFSSNMAWNRAFGILLSLPILLTVPLASVFLSDSIVNAYYLSRPDLNHDLDSQVAHSPLLPAQDASSGKSHESGVGAKTHSGIAESSSNLNSGKSASTPKTDKKAMALAELAQKPVGSCPDRDKEILSSLDPKGPEESTYWAIQALRCSTVRVTIGITKLATLMMEAPSAKVRAAAIREMKRYERQGPYVKQIGYLIFKRLGPHEQPEVIEAAASVLAHLGPDEQKLTTKRLTLLLDGTGGLSATAARALIEILGRDDLVADYVAAHLNLPGEARLRAVNMVCLLPKDKRGVAESHIQTLVESVHLADQDDPGIHALSCLGHAGFMAVQAELKSPQVLERSLAAQALSELNVKDTPEALETVDSCSRDANPQVRRWCSRSLGEIGAPALPKILELLKSSEPILKASGQNALESFTDLTAKDELIKIRSENSGWMANNRKLQIAKAVEVAIAKIQASTAVPMALPAGLPTYEVGARRSPLSLTPAQSKSGLAPEPQTSHEAHGPHEKGETLTK